MRILLDTHVYLWCITNDRKLSSQAKALVQEATEVYVSSASLWEAAIKIKLGKLKANINELISAVSESGFVALPISLRHTALVARLPDFHRDPFDRILICQAMIEPLKFITSDLMLEKYSELVHVI